MLTVAAPADSWELTLMGKLYLRNASLARRTNRAWLSSRSHRPPIFADSPLTPATSCAPMSTSNPAVIARPFLPGAAAPAAPAEHPPARGQVSGDQRQGQEQDRAEDPRRPLAPAVRLLRFVRQWCPPGRSETGQLQVRGAAGSLSALVADGE